EVHQPERNRKSAGEHEQQHAIGYAVEKISEDSGHGMKPNQTSRLITSSCLTCSGQSGPSAFCLPVCGQIDLNARHNAGHRASMTSRATSFLCLAGILDGVESLEFDVVELAVNLLDLSDVDVLDDVAGLRIDGNRATRTFPLHPLHRLDQLVAVRVAAGLL